MSVPPKQASSTLTGAAVANAPEGRRNGLGVLPAILILTALSIVWFLIVIRMPTSLRSVTVEAWHANVVINLLQTAAAPGDVLTANPDYPPLYYLAAYTAAKIAHSQSRAALAFPNLLMLWITAFAARALARRLFQTSGTAAAALTGLFFLRSSVITTGEMTTVAAVAVCALIFTEIARTDSPALYFLTAVTAALALLAKQTAPLFLLVPFAWTVFERRKSNRAGVQFWTSFLSSLVMGAILAFALFYSWRGAHELFENLLVRSMAVPGEVALHESGAGNYLYYASMLFSAAFLPLLALLAVRVLRARPTAAHAWMFACSAVPALVLTAFPTKFESYLLPAVPFWIVLLTSGSDTGRDWKHQRKIVAGAVLISVALLADNRLNWAERILSEYRLQVSAYDELSDALKEFGTCRDVAQFNGTISMSDYAFAQFEETRGGGCPRVNLAARPRAAFLTRYALVFRDPARFDSGKCFSAEELADWERSDLHILPPNNLEREAAKILIENFRPIRSVTRGIDEGGRASYPSFAMTICERID